MTKLPDIQDQTVRTPAECSDSNDSIRLETRIDRNGKLTYHSLSADTNGGVLEKVYDQENRLLKVIKRSGSSKSETFVDPHSGARTRVLELATMPDGNLASSDVIYYSSNRSSQVVTVFRPNGLLIRIIERELRGSMVTFQGQTDYDVNSHPVSTINQHIDPESGLLMHREQIHWLGEGQRAMTEHFYFDISGYTGRYVKILHNSGGAIFSEETQQFDPDTKKMVRRELAAFDLSGHQTCLDVLRYDLNGAVIERQSTFFDSSGKAIITRRSSGSDSTFESLLS